MKPLTSLGEGEWYGEVLRTLIIKSHSAASFSEFTMNVFVYEKGLFNKAVQRAKLIHKMLRFEATSFYLLHSVRDS